MYQGTRIALADDSTRTGTIVGHVRNTGEMIVQWDGVRGTVSISKQLRLCIVGFDPVKGSKRGVWRKKTILEKWLIYSA